MHPSHPGAFGRDRAERIADAMSVDLLDDEAHTDRRSIALAGRLAILGIAGVAISTVAIGVLHVVRPSRSLDPLSRTISEYALLRNGWIFNWSVLLLAAASVLVLAALIVRNMVPWRSWGAAM